MTTSKIYTTRHAKFDETLFPFIGNTPQLADATLLLSTFDEPVVMSLPTLQPAPLDTPSTPVSLGSHSSPCHLCPDLVQPIQRRQTPVLVPDPYPDSPVHAAPGTPPVTTTSAHPMLTCG